MIKEFLLEKYLMRDLLVFLLSVSMFLAVLNVRSLSSDVKELQRQLKIDSCVARGSDK